jgi:hypothetical protein
MGRRTTMTNPPQDAQSYMATGSTHVGFQTGNESIKIGIGAVGEICGVHGESKEVKYPDTNDAPSGTGVHGRGLFRGVYGKGRPTGKDGEDPEKKEKENPEEKDKEKLDSEGDPETWGGMTTGVLGEGYLHAFGVVGMSFSRHKTRTTLGRRAGVMGVSNAKSNKDTDILGAGVVGLSHSKLDSSYLPDPRDKELLADGTGVWGRTKGGIGVHGEAIDYGAGVRGDSKSGVGVQGYCEEQRGVAGHSDYGVGVNGTSFHGRGGVFSSDAQAQLRLLPSLGRITNPQFPPNLPRDGEVGDLIAILDDFGQASLWFCVRVAPATPPTAMWQLVELGRMVSGTT